MQTLDLPETNLDAVDRSARPFRRWASADSSAPVDEALLWLIELL
jgi:hypothetical protein